MASTMNPAQSLRAALAVLALAAASPAQDYESFVTDFRRALAVNPNLDGVRTIIEALEARTRGKRQTI